MAICWDKTTLMLAYTKAVKDYSDAITDLHELLPTLSKAEYEQLYKVAEVARIAAEEARSAMEQHIRKHGC